MSQVCVISLFILLLSCNYIIFFGFFTKYYTIYYIVHFYVYNTCIKSSKSLHLVNGSIAHLQSIDLRSKRGGFESQHRRCHFLGSMLRNSNFFFYKLRTMIVQNKDWLVCRQIHNKDAIKLAKVLQA